MRDDHAVFTIDGVDVFLDRPVMTFGGEYLFVCLAAEGAGEICVAALKAGGRYVNGLRPVVLAGAGRFGVGAGRVVVIDNVLVGVLYVVVGDGQAIITKLHGDGRAVLQRDEVGAGLIVIRPIRHGVVIVGGHVVVVVGRFVDDGSVVVVVVGDVIVVIALEVVDTGIDVVGVVDGGGIGSKRCDLKNGSGNANIGATGSDSNLLNFISLSGVPKLVRIRIVVITTSTEVLRR